MTETEFLVLSAAVLRQIEQSVESAAADAGVDVECSFSGNVLEIEFVDNGSKIIVNSQAPMQEIWVAAKSGGFHFRCDGDRWVDTRSGEELYAALTKMASAQAGHSLTLT